MKLTEKYRLSLERKQNIWFYFFIMPFIFGFVFFFVYPFIQSIIFSLSELEISREGYHLNYVGMNNYRHSLFVHTNYQRTLIESVVYIFTTIPFVLSFSFFIAIILNQNFKGRTLFRVIFFLPVIMSAGIILRMEDRNSLIGTLDTISSLETIGLTRVFSSFIEQFTIPPQILEYAIDGAGKIKSIIRFSGVQILIFLAGLQSIPQSLYEVAKVEGANNWERFWKITLPLLSPIILTNIIYTLVENFTSTENSLMILILETSIGGLYGVSTAMAWLYLIVIGFLVLITILIISKWVYYQN